MTVLMSLVGVLGVLVLVLVLGVRLPESRSPVPLLAQMSRAWEAVKDVLGIQQRAEQTVQSMEVLL